jgi:hypothetical protein
MSSFFLPFGEDADDKLRLPNRAQTANHRETQGNAMDAGR